jgi:predicted MPP superfamily phosphohydrolase
MALIGLYGYFEARNVRTEHVIIKSGKIPPSASRIRIVHISDVHIGQIVREARVKDILQRVEAAGPDILISTGDLVDGHQRHFSGIEKLFLDVRPRLGKYAIVGNHEYYVGIEKSIAFTKESGFKVLRDENFELGGLISITGIDDSRNREEQAIHAAMEKRLLQEAPDRFFRLLLKHRPVIEKDSLGKFDLQLSGHTHKGQIFPFNLLTWLIFPVRTGLTSLESRGFLYVSRGTGVWGPPIRFLAPPEITILDLVPESAAQ